MDVSQVMTSNPEHLPPTASIREAADMMKGMDVGSVPIVSQDQLIGIVTDRDIVVRGVAGGLTSQAQLSEIMSHDVHSVSPTDDVKRAFKLMEKNQIRRLPVVDESGGLTGIVSLGDLATRTKETGKSGEALEDISSRK